MKSFAGWCCFAGGRCARLRKGVSGICSASSGKRGNCARVSDGEFAGKSLRCSSLLDDV